jgi:hypothetical protein
MSFTVEEISFEEKFRFSLNLYIEKRKLRPTAIADDAKIKRDVFSRIRHTSRRIFGDEMVAISRAIGMTVEELASFSEKKAG